MKELNKKINKINKIGDFNVNLMNDDAFAAKLN